VDLFFRLNNSKINLSQFKNMIEISRIPLHAFKGRISQECYHRYFSSNGKESWRLTKKLKTIPQRNDFKYFFTEKNLYFIKIRISLLILDLLLILFRCYHIYRDFQSIWFGSERFIPYKYFAKMAEDQNENNIDQFMFEKKVSP